MVNWLETKLEIAGEIELINTYYGMAQIRPREINNSTLAKIASMVGEKTKLKLNQTDNSTSFRYEISGQKNTIELTLTEKSCLHDPSLDIYVAFKDTKFKKVEDIYDNMTQIMSATLNSLKELKLINDVNYHKIL